MEQPTATASPPQPALPVQIPYERFLDCVHCGLCTAACPTYVELGDENDSPRGRIYLMRAVVDGRISLGPAVRRHLERCLDCRACETACPSGVQYGRLIEPFRVAMEQALPEHERASNSWFHRRLLFGTFPYPQRLRRQMVLARWLRRLGVFGLLRLTGLMRLLPQEMQQLVDMLPPEVPRTLPLPPEAPALGRRRARVALFTGCVAQVMFPHVHWATVRVLQHNGCDVVIPQNQVCCGAIHYHGGQSEPARELADRNLEAFSSLDVDAVVVNVAGCGSMLKEYGHHWDDEKQPQREQLAAKVKDICEFLDHLGLEPPRHEVRMKVTYHDACHLAHAQQVRAAPRRLLAQVPGLEVVPLAESDMCCGAAGTYNLTEVEMATRLARRKLRNILATGAEAVVSANAGCTLQIAREARRLGHALEVLHPVELLDRAYRGSGGN